MDIKEYLNRQIGLSVGVFGPGERTEGIVDHIVKELYEIRDAKNSKERVKEFVDVVILALDGAWRELVYVQRFPVENVSYLLENELKMKFFKNVMREWPDWRTAEPGKAIEHVRGDYHE